MKLVCIGASYKFVKRVITDLIITGEFEGSEIIVVDICKEPLEIVVHACQAITAEEKANIKISGTMDIREALPGADFVLVSIAVGGFEAWRKDIDICNKFGIQHVIGDTIGPAALARSLRTIPVMLKLGDHIKELCPEAWVINISNPMATTVKALSEIGKLKVLGLCHGGEEIKDKIAKAYDTDSSNVDCEVLGVNHLPFAGSIYVKDRNVTQTLYRDVENCENKEEHKSWSLGREYFKLSGSLPLTDDKHLVEFFPFYLKNASGNGSQYGVGAIDFDSRIAHRDRLERIHRDLADGKIKLDRPLRFSGEEIHGVILSLYYGKESIHVLNIPNRGYCAMLPEGTVLEIPALVTRDRVEIRPMKSGEFEPHIIAMINNLNVIYDYTVEAAVSGDRKKAMQALLLDPMVRDLDIIHIIPQLLEELIQANKDYLPAFG